MAISEGDRHDAYLRRTRNPVPDVNGVLSMLRRRAMFIAGVTLACFAVSLLYILLATPRYVASGRIDLSAQITADDPGPIQSIMSRRIFDRTIARERLEDDPLFGARPRGILSAFLIGIGLVPVADAHALALRQLERAVRVTRDPNVSALNVMAVTPDRETSARIVNAVMDSYIEDMAPPQKEFASGTGIRPDAALEALQKRLRDAEQRYQTYRQDNGIADSNPQSIPEKQDNALSARIVAAETRIASLRSALSQLQRARNGQDREAIPPSLLSRPLDALRNRYAIARRVEADLSETLGPRHPDLKYARQQLAEAGRALDQALSDIAQSATGELERARSELIRLKSRLDALKKDPAVSDNPSARLRELERDVEDSRADYQAFLLKSQNVGEQQRPNESFARIASRAMPPLERDGGSPVRVLLVSLVLGLGLALSLASLLELARRRSAES